jgi:hypothetical protein
VIGDWFYGHFVAYVPNPDRSRPDTPLLYFTMRLFIGPDLDGVADSANLIQVDCGPFEKFLTVIRAT